MRRSIIIFSKLFGVAGLGLLSSSALTISFASIPALLALPSPSGAVPAVYKLRQHVAAAQRFLTISTGALLTSAYLLSPRYAKHPFLIYMGISIGLASLGVPRLVKSQDLDALNEIEIAEEGRGRTSSGARINGEIVKQSIEGWGKLLKWQSLVWGTGWAMGTVGLWGDGY